MVVGMQREREGSRPIHVGIGLPATIPAAPGKLILDWARRADEAPFSTLAMLDRVLYDSFESLTVLAAAAAITSRIRLAATIVIAPLRSTALLAKQAASIDALSGGRLTLGVGLGARSDDYEATGTDYGSRGRTLTERLAGMRDWWEDEDVGPRPLQAGGPKLLVGGAGGLAMGRMARFADGYIFNGGPPRAFARLAAEARAAWEDAGRPGRPAIWAMDYFALGNASEGTEYLKDYYAFTGAFADRIAAGLLTSPEEIVEFAHAHQEAGCDELILFPAVAEIGQLDRLADVLADAALTPTTGQVSETWT